ncbi:MAG TPA: DUF2071 domain-containing protein [Gemmatimonadaceae bacterium]|nr:DUF2071 domain-containing protein [Gemmatimonadaceae bacterium]
MTAISDSSKSNFLAAAWRDLVVINYEVAPQSLAARIPAGTELDLFEGRALVSAVGFQFLDTRLRGVAIPFHRNFDEVNLRFYVKRQVGDEVRHGVVFIRELVGPPFVALIARLAYNEPYETAPVRRVASVPAGRIEYAWGRGRIGATAANTPAIPAVGSEQAFVTQRHWGYTRQRDGSTIEYHVTHPPWRVCDAAEAIFVPDAPGGSPVSAYLVDGSAVEVTAPSRV